MSEELQYVPNPEDRVFLNSYVLNQNGPQQSSLPEAKNCSVVLYHRDVLARDNDEESPEDLSQPWEIITVLANMRETPGCEPMKVSTLLYNHFHQDGGTATNWTAEQLETAVKESFLYWKDRDKLDGRNSYWKISNEELVSRCESALQDGEWDPGYIDGVILVHIKVNPGEFFCPVVQLKEGDKLTGEYKARRPGETPRKNLGVVRD